MVLTKPILRGETKMTVTNEETLTTIIPANTHPGRVCLSVNDLRIMTDFYQSVIGFSIVRKEEGAVYRSAGSKIRSKPAVEKFFSTSTNKNRFSFY